MKILILLTLLISIFSCSVETTKQDKITNDIVNLIQEYPEMWNTEYKSITNDFTTYTYKIKDKIIIEIQIYSGAFEEKVSLSQPQHIKLNPQNSRVILDAFELWKINKTIKELDNLKPSKTEEQKPLNKQEDIFIKENLLVIPEQK